MSDLLLFFFRKTIVNEFLQFGPHGLTAHDSDDDGVAIPGKLSDIGLPCSDGVPGLAPDRTSDSPERFVVIEQGLP